MASVPWVKNVLYNLLWPVISKKGKGLRYKARTCDTEMVVSGSVMREKAMPVKVALKTVSEGQKCNIWSWLYPVQQLTASTESLFFPSIYSTQVPNQHHNHLFTTKATHPGNYHSV